MLAKWITLLYRSKKVPGLNPGWGLCLHVLFCCVSFGKSKACMLGSFVRYMCFKCIKCCMKVCLGEPSLLALLMCK